MGMLDIFEKLKSLQAILVRKYELESKIEEAPKRLGSQDELLARMRKEFIEKNKEYDEIKEMAKNCKRVVLRFSVGFGLRVYKNANDSQSGGTGRNRFGGRAYGYL